MIGTGFTYRLPGAGFTSACACGRRNCFGCETYEKYKQYAPPPATNFDRIHRMPVEELAETYAGGCPNGDRLNCGKYYLHGGRDCFNCWLDWLKAPVEVDE